MVIWISLCACSPSSNEATILEGTDDTTDLFAGVVVVNDRCTGTLIDARHVITAAHCICPCGDDMRSACDCSPHASVTTISSVRGREVFQGSVNVNPEFYWQGSPGTDCKKTDAYRADVAVITLTGQPDSYYRRIPVSWTAPSVGDATFIVGFGKASCADTSGHLGPRRFGENRIYSFTPDEDQIKLVAAGGELPWKGDSGGPLIDRTLGQVVVGVASAGVCGVHEFYTNVTAYAPWLAEAVGQCSGKVYCCGAADCIDLQSDRDHCGTCGGTCQTFQECVNGACVESASCSDGVRNGQETGIDCGGPMCHPCPTCSDGIRNQGEAGIDCGGPCPFCATCGNGVREGGEQCDDADFGGATCAALGHTAGTLSCSACITNTSQCCDSECLSGSRCLGETRQTCGNYDADACLEWGGDMTCAFGCANESCNSGPVCGNGVREGSEACDGADLGGSTCQSLGFSAGGPLACAACTLETSGCCNNDCTQVASTRCTGGVQQTCNFHDPDACLDWGGDIACSSGCFGDTCSSCTLLYSQDFEADPLIDENVVGSQVLADGAQFWDCCNVSLVRQGTGQSPSALALNLHMNSSGSPGNVYLSLPANVTSSQRAHVVFWVFNPLATSYTIDLQRAGGPAYVKSIPPGGWTLVEDYLTSSLSTGAVIVHLGLIPNSGTSWNFKMDNVTIETCP